MQPHFSHSLIGDAEFKAYHKRMNLKLRIREIRESKGMTLADVAGVVGISVPHLSQVERGIKNVNNHLLTRIASALGCQPRDLIEGAENKDAMDLALILDVLGPEDRERVRAFAEALASSQQGGRQDQ